MTVAVSAPLLPRPGARPQYCTGVVEFSADLATWDAYGKRTAEAYRFEAPCENGVARGVSSTW